ncbi:MAG TPA: HD domain-containing phosphohydrolase [Anaerolineales bacterium]|nr:HD domain-containing phosphohydrolase [Anaerolineales bacterium]
MSEPVRILLVEDLPTDVGLAQREICKALPACIFEQVETREDFLQALEKFRPDLIISDYHMPRFDGMMALKLALERLPDIPVIIWTGSMSEDIAVECMRAGAINYVIKEHIKRLGPAVIHALDEKRLRVEHRQAEQALRVSEERFRLLVENNSDIITILNSDGTIRYESPSNQRVLGYPLEEMVGRSAFDFVHPDDQIRLMGIFNDRIEVNGYADPVEYRVAHKDGSWRIMESIAQNLISDPIIAGIVVNSRDITERKRAEEEIERRTQQLLALHEIDMAIVSHYDLQQMLNVILGNVLAQLKVDAASVLLLDPSGQKLGSAFTRGFRTKSRKELSAGGEFVAQNVLERGKMTILDLSQAVRQTKTGLLQKEAFVFYCGMPLVAKGKVKGVLEVFQRAPFEPAREWLEFIQAFAVQIAIAIDSVQLIEDLRVSNANLIKAYDETLIGWSQAMDFRDRETEGHSQRVAQMTVELAQTLGIADEDSLKYIRWGALLHDMGKIAIPDSILYKNDKLTPGDEEVIMRRHPEIAYKMLSPISFLRPALDIPYCHHEKWDGTGYPRGLKGEEIPLAARIFAVVDVWDALRSDRPYRKAWSEEEALKYIWDHSGMSFEPRIVEAFMNLMRKKSDSPCLQFMQT